MLLELTPDQEFLRETTAKFLDKHVPVGEVRRLRDDPQGFEADYWKRGADLGWTSLLVGEDRGGGSVSGQGLVDLTLIAHEFGRHAAPGPLLATSVVASALGADPTESNPEVLDGLLAGTTIASWCFQGPGSGTRPGPVEARVDGGQVVLDGTYRPVEAAAQADYLLVSARSGDGVTQVLVPADTPGVSVQPMQTVDLTRRAAMVTFEDVRVPSGAVLGQVGQAAEQVERQLQQAIVILNAECVGAMQRAFDMTVEWAFDRYSFGRPLASYQELKHRFADMKSWLEASHAAADAAAAAVQAGAPSAMEAVSIAKAFIGHYGVELMQDCVQIHGGIGVTFEHDLHLFLRRVTLDRSLLGTPAEHRRQIGALALEREIRG